MLAYGVQHGKSEDMQQVYDGDMQLSGSVESMDSTPFGLLSSLSSIDDMRWILT